MLLMMRKRFQDEKDMELFVGYREIR
jgi:hypothetical protein